MQRATRWGSRHARTVLAAVLFLTLAALASLFDTAAGRLRLAVDPSMDALLVPDSPEQQFYAQLRLRFGNDESVLVMLSTADIFTVDSLRRIATLSDELASLPGVARVQSLTTIPLATVSDVEVQLETIAPDGLDAAALQRLREQVRSNPLLAGNLVSDDGRSAALEVRLETLSDREILEQRIAERIRETAAAHAAPGVAIAVAGASVVREAISLTVMEQLRWLMPAVAALLGLMLALTFRSIRGVLLPLVTISIALAWTLAAQVWLGLELNLVTSLVPPLLITMGLAYCAHVLCEYEALALRIADSGERIAHLLREIAGPVTLTAATTAIGLLALALNDLPAIRQFAFLAALGVVFTAILTLSFLPALLYLLAPVATRPLPGEAGFVRGSRWLGSFDISNRRLILAAATAIFAVATAAGLQVETGDRFVGVFAPDTKLRSDYEKINHALGGVTPLLISLDGGRAGVFEDPHNLRAVEQLQDWLRAQPEVGAVTSVADHVRMLSSTLGSRMQEIPESATLVRQLLFFGSSEALSAQLNGDHSATLISLRVRSDDTSEITALLQRLQPRLEQLPQGIEARVSGNAVLLAESVQSVTSDQMFSIALALLLVFLCLALQFSSVRIGLLAFLPTLLQTSLYFGALGLAGIKLNATTSLVECLVLGLAVDDTIHYLARFNSAAKRQGSEGQAAVLALGAVLRPVTMTKAMLALGFLMLVTGDLQNQVMFGWLTAFMLLAAWLVDIFVTPAFMSGVRVVTLWDSLLLNLGKDVQQTIPLFSGLSNRQARIFALMSRLETRGAGERILSEGDPAGDVYVVIDGEVCVWREREGQRVDIARFGRGAVIGETGYFGQKRTANVDVAASARLLRFDDADQERICKHYPAIAARVFLNLNRIQAERRGEGARRS